MKRNFHCLILLLCCLILTFLFSACDLSFAPTGIPPFVTETISPSPTSLEPASTPASDPSILTTETAISALSYPAPIPQIIVAYPYPYPVPFETPPEVTLMPPGVEPTISPPGISIEDLVPITAANADELRQVGWSDVLTDAAEVISIDFSPGGDNLAIGNRDGNVYILSLSTGEVLQKLNVGWVDKLAYAPQGNYLVIGGGSHIIIWELDTWQTRIISAHLGANRQLRSLAISPDGKLIVSCGNDGRVRIWEVQTGGLLSAWYDWSGPYDVAFSPNGKMVATAGGLIRLWDYESGLAFKTMRDSWGTTYRIAFNPNGKILATGGRDYNARLWDVKTGELLSVLEGPTGRENNVAFSPDGSILATGGYGEILLWRVETGELVATISSIRGNSIPFNHEWTLLASPEGSRIIFYGVTSSGE